MCFPLSWFVYISSTPAHSPQPRPRADAQQEDTRRTATRGIDPLSWVGEIRQTVRISFHTCLRRRADTGCSSRRPRGCAAISWEQPRRRCWSSDGCQCAWVVDIEADERTPELNKLAHLLTTHEAGSILVAGPVGERAMRRVADLALLHHCGLLAVMPTETLAGHSPVIVWSGDSPLVQMARIPRRPWEATAKRCVDVLLATVGLIIAAPVLAVLALSLGEATGLAGLSARARWTSRQPVQLSQAQDHVLDVEDGSAATR